jgi:hypothetical protein
MWSIFSHDANTTPVESKDCNYRSNIKANVGRKEVELQTSKGTIKI